MSKKTTTCADLEAFEQKMCGLLGMRAYFDDGRDDYWERYDALIEAMRDEGPRRAGGCRCGSDLPGRCPGPENCPMCNDEEDHDDA